MTTHRSPVPDLSTPGRSFVPVPAGLDGRLAAALRTPTPSLEHLIGYPPRDVSQGPEQLFAPYRTTVLRNPEHPLELLPQRLTEVTGPVFGHERVAPGDSDLTVQSTGEPIGERIIVFGKVLDTNGRPVPDVLLELWQANAAGRYIHDGDRHPAPLDPHFRGIGRVATNAEGAFSVTTIKPGAYPWRNHPNAWRPAHIHFSIFGRAFTQRLITQMYFPGDPLFYQDPIYNAIPDEKVRQRLISRFDLTRTQNEWALAYEFNIVLNGTSATPVDEEDDD